MHQVRGNSESFFLSILLALRELKIPKVITDKGVLRVLKSIKVFWLWRNVFVQSIWKVLMYRLEHRNLLWSFVTLSLAMKRRS